MRVLQIHNRYRSGPSGEDIVVQLEREMLSRRGHVVECLYSTNEGAATESWQQFGGALNAIWSRRSYAQVRDKIRDFEPDIIHIHNTFASFSPSVHWAAADAGVPSVATLHNYGIACPSRCLFRDLHVCEECIGRLPAPALLHGCRYAGSRWLLYAIAATQMVHRALGTFTKKVDGFIVLSEFQKHLMVRAGLPEQRIFVKPNFVPDANEASSIARRRKRVVFAGQVASIKGIGLLVEAWMRVQPSGWQLEVLGDGPDRERLEAASAADPSIVWRGWASRDEVLKSIASSRYLALPARWYEPFGLVIAEAMAASTPVIVSNVGHLAEMITDGREGLSFDVAEPGSLENTLRTAVATSHERWSEMSACAREHYLTRFTEEENYARLVGIYEQVSQSHAIGARTRARVSTQDTVSRKQRIACVVSCVDELPDTHLQFYADTLAGMGMRVVFIAPGHYDPALGPPGITHIPLHTQRYFVSASSRAGLLRAILGRLSNGVRLVWRLARIRPTICVCCEPDAWALSVIARGLAGCRVVEVVREIYQENLQGLPARIRPTAVRAFRGLTSYLSKRTSALVFASRAIKDFYSYLPVEGQVISLMPDLRSFERGSAMANPQADASAGELVMAHAGPLRHTYASECLLDAIRQLEGEGVHVRLIVIGGVYGELDNNEVLEDLVTRGVVKINPYMHFSGVVEELFKCDVGISLVRPEGYGFTHPQPRKLFEYMAAGLPCLVADVPTLRAIVDEWQCGLAVDPLSPESIADAIRRMAADPSLLREMGLSARRAAETAFNRDLERTKLVGLLQDSCLEPREA